MKKLFLFMMVSLDGYFEGPDHDLSWHNVDADFNDFAIAQLREADTLLFGRRTYQLMEDFWPSKDGLEGDPVVANLMNTTAKVVVSKSLEKVTETDHWKNIRLIKNNVPEEIRMLKNQPGKAIALLGSNNLLVNLMQANLVDEFRIMINPVVIGKGTAFFSGITDKYKFKLHSTQTFRSGNILLYYLPTNNSI